MNANIIEIFRSIQGEGIYAGVSQVFVRFFECNMHCSWCDTPHSIGDTTRKFNEMDLGQVLASIEAQGKGCHSVSLTGGEPLLQYEFIKVLAAELKKQDKRTYLETNGTLPQELKHVLENIDIVAMDIKLPSSTKQRSFWKEHAEFLEVSSGKDVFVKAVITHDTEDGDVAQAIELVAQVDPAIPFILQPNYFEMKNGIIEKCTGLLKYSQNRLNDVRILPQVHKFMKIR